MKEFPTARYGIPNVLLNWDFSHPVNQRGQHAYTGSGYTVDRWRLTDAASSLALESGFVRLISGVLEQPVEFPERFAGYTLTLSALLHAEVGTSGVETVYVTPDGREHAERARIEPSNGYKVARVTFTLPNEPITFFGCRIVADMRASVKRAKLEPGSESTLLDDLPPDFGDMLARCQRYFYSVDSDIGLYGDVSLTGKSIFYNVPCCRTMRREPTLAKISGMIHCKGVGGVRHFDDIADLHPRIYNYSAVTVMLEVDNPDIKLFPTGTPTTASRHAGVTLWLDAEM